MKKKIAVGNLNSVESLKGLRFDSAQFAGIPEALECVESDVKFREKKDYGDGGKVEKAYGFTYRVTFKGRDLKLLNTYKTLEASGMAEQLGVLLTALSDVTVIYDAVDDAGYSAIQTFEKEYDKALKSLKTGQVIVLENMKVGVYPRWVSKGSSGAFSGVQLVLDNIDSVSVSVADRVTFDELDG